MNNKRMLLQKSVNRAAAAPEPTTPAPEPPPEPAPAALDADALKQILSRLDRLEADVRQLGQRVAVLETAAGELRRAGRREADAKLRMVVK